MNKIIEFNALLLADPAPTADLNQLARELNELAKVRQNARLAFCRRLAAAYLLIVGHRPSTRSSDGRKFRTWCDENIHAANGKRYSHRTLELYLIIGFARNPESIIAQRTNDTNKRAQKMRRFGAALAQAPNKDAPKVWSIKEARAKLDVSTDVARELNILMKAWEDASPQARSQFLYIVAGRKVA